MNDFDLGYATAFFEGEGNLTLGLYADGFFGIVQVYQKAEEPLKWLQEHFGGAVRKPKNKSAWYWCRCAGSALPFLRAVLPGTKTPLRRKEIQLYIEFWTTADRARRIEILKWWVTRIARRTKQWEENYESMGV